MSSFVKIVAVLGCLGVVLDLPGTAGVEIHPMHIISSTILESYKKHVNQPDVVHEIVRVHRESAACMKQENFSDNGSKCERENRIYACTEPLLDVLAECFVGDKDSTMDVLKVVAKNVVKEVACGSLEEVDTTEPIPDQCKGVDAKATLCRPAPMVDVNVPIADLNALQCRELVQKKTCLQTAIGDCYGSALYGIIVDSVYSANGCNVKRA